MDEHGKIYAAENPPVEDVTRLDGYLRGLADGASDEDVREAMEVLRDQRDDALREAAIDRVSAENERRARDVSDALRIEEAKRRGGPEVT